MWLSDLNVILVAMVVKLNVTKRKKYVLSQLTMIYAAIKMKVYILLICLPVHIIHLSIYLSVQINYTMLYFVHCHYCSVFHNDI